jgi:hypothetical protein
MALAALAWPSLVSAQAATGTDRIRVSVNGGVQLSSIGFDSSAAKTVYLETAVIGGSYDVTHGLAIDGGVSVRLAGNVGVALAVSSFMQEHDAAVSAAIPHPFFFRTPRTITGTAPSLRHDEVVTHLQGSYTLHPSRRVDLLLSAGPSFFHVRQEVVTDIAFTDTYPYDAPAFTSASAQRVTAKNKVGYNAGADVGMRLARHAGVGASVRFSRANVSLAMPSGTATVSMDAGGTQVTGGLRLYF